MLSSTVLTRFRFVLGIAAVLIGAAIFVWIGYNEFVHRLPEYEGTHWWEPLGIAPALLSVGVYWLRRNRGNAGLKSERKRG